MVAYKSQKLRDPLHGIIPIEASEFENVMWDAIQTLPFQRLRRVKQLGFSEFVYPGATHSRFAHSIGVFHTARRLMKIIKFHLQKQNSFQESLANRALAAALVHDVGHGPFSHAFEEVGRILKLELAHHETVSDKLIRDSELTIALNKLGSGFASDVADIVKGDGEATLYSAVVSSQFDADRLDYMRRDRLMSGSNHGAIDFDWLVDNIEIGTVSTGIDEVSTGTVETFVLGQKAVYAAEAYVLGLFHLYPAVYLHKTTRGVEKIFTNLLRQVVQLAQDGEWKRTGLPHKHPLLNFARKPDSLDCVLALDDTVVWGSLPMLCEATDSRISEFASRLQRRSLYKAIDIREKFREGIGENDSGDTAVTLDKLTASAVIEIEAWNEEQQPNCPTILLDVYKRSPYKQKDLTKGPINQIMIRTAADELVDLGKLSPAVSAIEPFRVCRAYVNKDDDKAIEFLNSVIQNGKAAA